MSEGFYTILGAFIAAFATIAALFLGNILNNRAQRKARLLEIQIARCDEQIGKFYAPLANLVEQLDRTDDLKKELVEQDPDNSAAIEKLIYDNYFLQIHLKIAEILEHQLHLLEENEMPPSFIDYYGHVASERVLYSLRDKYEEAKRSGILSDEAARINFKPIPYPEPDFKNVIMLGFKNALRRQEIILRSMDRKSEQTTLEKLVD